MLGDTVRTTRIKRGLTQAKLARLAGVSRRHLAALEKGANVSVNVLKKVALVLDLTEIQLGGLSVRTAPGEGGAFNVPLIADTIREARADADRAQSLLARAEGLLTGEREPAAASRAGKAFFPLPPVRRITRGRTPDTITDGEPVAKVNLAGEIKHGEPVDESAAVTEQTALVPLSLIEKGEIVFRFKGNHLEEHGFEDGDLLVVELRPRGKASTGEMVIGKIGDNLYVGRWWQKHGRRAVMGNNAEELASGTADKNIKVVAVINQIIRQGK